MPGVHGSAFGVYCASAETTAGGCLQIANHTVRGHRPRAWACGTLALWVAVSLGACGARDTDLAGIWKSDCDDSWGILIKPLQNGFHGVTFCGLSGCFGAGEWAPDTRITGDPMYEVVSDEELRIRRNDGGFFTYRRCSSDRSWPVAKTGA